jgi:hypothetical protein
MSTVEEFSRNALDLVVLMTFGVFYLYSFARLKKSYLRRLGSAQNESITVLFLGGVVASAVNLVHTADAASDAILFFLEQNNPVRALLYALCFFMAAWVLSFLLFRASFWIVSKLSQEDEREELAKNNQEIAWLHVIILVVLTFVIAPAWVKIAVSFIPYPALPF